MSIILDMDKRYTHHLWTRFRRLKPWYFLLIFVFFALLSVVTLRQNNLEMADLRTQVYNADKNGTDVVKALQNLQAYVTTHMNTNLSNGPNSPYPPIQLEYTYDRAVEAAGAAVSAADSQVYTDAQHYCEQQDPVDFSGHNRVPCVQQYVQNHGISLPTIPSSLYEFDFVSPVWSPDLAGWSIVAAVLSLMAFVVSWVVERYLRLKSK